MCATMPNTSLPKSAQFRHSSEYAHIYTNGKRVRGKYIRIVALNNDKNTPRLGLSVGKKFANSAVKRNRVRRVLRAAFRLQAQNIGAWDIILIPNAPDRSYRTPIIEKELMKLIGKLNSHS